MLIAAAAEGQRAATTVQQWSFGRCKGPRLVGSEHATRRHTLRSRSLALASTGSSFLLLVEECVASELIVALAPPANPALALATTILLVPTVAAAVVGRLFPASANDAVPAVVALCSYMVKAFASMVIAVNAGFLYP